MQADSLLLKQTQHAQEKIRSKQMSTTKSVLENIKLEDRIRVMERFLDDENIVTIASIINTHTVNNQSLDNQNIEPP